MAKTSSPQLLEPGGGTGSSSAVDNSKPMSEKSRDQLEQEIRELQHKVLHAEQALRSVEERMHKHKAQSNRMVLTMRLKLQRQEEMIRGLRRERERLMGYITSHLLFVEGALRREQKQIQRLLAEKDHLIEKKSKEIKTLKVTVLGGTKDYTTVATPRGIENVLAIICEDNEWQENQDRLIEEQQFRDNKFREPHSVETAVEEHPTCNRRRTATERCSLPPEKCPTVPYFRDDASLQDASTQSLPTTVSDLGSTSSAQLSEHSVGGVTDDGGDPTEPEINPKVLQLHGSYERLTDLGKKGVKATSSSGRPYLTNHRSVTRPRDVKCRRQVARFRSRPAEDVTSTSAVGIARSVVLSL